MKIHSLQITAEMLKIIAEIDEFRGGWKKIQYLTPERLEVLRQVATIESIGSSTRIEGVKLTDKEIVGILGGVGKTSFKTRDEQEVVGYAEAMETIFSNFHEIPLTENYIKQLHSILLRYSDKDERHRGRYKTLSNNVEAFDAMGKSLGIVFKTASPFDTPQEVEKLLSWTNETLEDKSIHPLLTIGVFGVVFLAIHPFQDGNGRLSRILSTLLLLKAEYSYIPYSSLESIIERNKKEYYLGLRRTQGTLDKESPDWTPWITFFLRSLRSQKNHLEQKMIESNGWESLPADSVKILDYLTNHKKITITEAEEITATPRATLKTRLADLIEQDFIIRVGVGRGTRYILKKD
jgi:Fic family protein